MKDAASTTTRRQPIGCRTWYGNILKCILTIASALATGNAYAQCANPSGGYQGFGATSGGAGQTVYTVTRLDDPNPTVAGTLRDALKSGNRCIVFNVGGVITLNSSLLHLNSSASNITVDGFTAPSPGITVKDYGSTFSGNDVIIRGIRFRNAQGCNSCTSHGNGIVIRGQRVVVDRVSIDGYGDQALGVGKGGMNVTVQWSIFGRGSDPTHNLPFLVNGWAAGSPGGPETNRVSIHHNLFIDGATRNPQATWDQTKAYQTYVTADIRNNLIWNFLNYGTVINKRAQANVVNNYYKRSSGANDKNALWLETEGRAYTSGNVASDNGNLNDNGTQGSAYSAAAVTTTDACTAAYDVVRLAGARGPNFGLDNVDSTYIGGISNPLPNCPIPAQPSDLTATAVSSSQINLAWKDNAANETGFKVERKTGAGGTYSQIATPGAVSGVGGTGTYNNNSGLSPSTSYYYRVRSYNASGNSAYSNEANATTLAGGSSIAFRAASSATSGTSSVTSLAISKPSGVVSGDFMLAALSIGSSSTAVTGVPSGWTLVRTISDGVGLHIYRKQAGGSEPTSYTWTIGTSRKMAGGIVAFSGVSASTPIQAENGAPETGSATTTHTTPTISTSGSTTWLVSIFADRTIDGSNPSTWTPPSGTTERVDTRTTSGSTNISVAMNTVGPVSSGSKSHTSTGTASSAEACMQIIAIQP